ncbi:glycosyltransferase family 4 protein [Escherichia coli]|nr:glycosyltransferase family 4 protein [Escherichia coli]ELU6966828.1 glycosyltransferase family 4 protein [Escherichia coli]
MKLLLIIDDYIPESTRVGAKMFHELALELSKNGHEVTILTPNSNLTQCLRVELIDGISVWYFKSGKLKDIGLLKRAINESLLSYRAWKAIKLKINDNAFDGIVYYSPSIFFGHLIDKIKSRLNCPSYLVLRDIFPQWAIDAGILKKHSPITYYFRYFESALYKSADRIGLMSKGNLDLFCNSKKKHKNKCEVLYNWADNTLPVHDESYSSIVRKYNLHDKVIFFYGGNIGHAQDMSNLMRLVIRMSKFPEAHFLFVGQGDEVRLIKNIATEQNLSNFTYIPSVSQSTYRSLLREINVGLFSLAASHSFHNFPGKLLNYMAHSVPILGSVNAGNDLIEIITKYNAGLVNVNGEDDVLYNNAVKLLRSEKLRQKFGVSGRQLLIDKFSVKAAALQIIKGIEHENY